MVTTSEIVGVRLNLPDDWYDVDLDADDAREWIASIPIAYDDNVDREVFAGMLTSLRDALIADAVDVAAVHLASPNRGIIGAAMLFELLERGPDDTPESYLAFVNAHSDLRSPELDISAFQSWTGTHPFGAFVAFSHLALVTLPGSDESSLEERVVFTIFPESTTQLVQITFRSARLGIFEDITAEAASMVGNMELELEPA